jgi:ATP synthase protein I
VEGRDVSSAASQPVPAPAAEADDPYRAMLRGALVPTAAVVLVATAAGLVLGGRVLAGAALGAAVVVAFFATSLLVMSAVRHAAPEMLLAAALSVYAAKVAVLGGLVFWLRDEAWLSPTAFAVTALACAVAWLAGQVRAFTRMRLPVWRTGSKSSA